MFSLASEPLYMQFLLPVTLFPYSSHDFMPLRPQAPLNNPPPQCGSCRCRILYSVHPYCGPMGVVAALLGHHNRLDHLGISWPQHSAFHGVNAH